MGKDEELDNGTLISQVRLKGLRPSQIFSKHELLEDEEFKKAVEAEVDYKLWLESKEIEQYEKKEIEEYEKMNSENELIPGPQPKESEKKEEQKKESDDNELIPDVDDSDSSSQDDDDSMVPD